MHSAENKGQQRPQQAGNKLLLHKSTTEQKTNSAGYTRQGHSLATGKAPRRRQQESKTN